MFQEEMFSDGSFKGAKYIANGCFGSVFSLPGEDGWVVKYAEADGTLNYLEWCRSRQAAGLGMRGMPETDVLVHIDPVSASQNKGRYMVTMRKYEDAGPMMVGHGGFNVASTCANAGHEYIGELIDAFDDYCFEVFRCSGFVDDLHRGNIMWDSCKSEFVVTDPSSKDYCVNNTAEFNLH